MLRSCVGGGYSRQQNRKQPTMHYEKEILALMEIRIDGGTQSRAEINEEAVQEYADAMDGGAELPPLDVFYDGKHYWLADGFHRYHASIRVDKADWLCRVFQGTQRDAVLYSTGANQSHGLRRTNEDKREAVRIMLEDSEWSQWSDNQIAEHVGVGNKMVSRMRGDLSLSKTKMRPATRTVTRAGKTYEMSVKNIGVSKAKRAPKAKSAAADVEDLPEITSFDNLPPAPPQTDPVESLGNEVDAMAKDLRALAGKIRKTLGFAQVDGHWTNQCPVKHRMTYVGTVMPLLEVARELERGRPVRLNRKGEVVTAHDEQKEAKHA